jgi:hypothetical protein
MSDGIIMKSKIDYCMTLIYQAISNLVIAKIPCEEIVEELLTTHRSELKLYDVAPEMQIVFLQCMAEAVWYAIHKQHYQKI